MSRAKRRQRSTQIRKRIEKKQREEDKVRKREAKGQAKDDEVVLRMLVARDAAEAALGQLRDLESRLAGGPIRGWTPEDLGGEHGLSTLADLVGAALDRQTDERLVVELTVAARGPLLERLAALEIAASGLKVEWEAGLPEITQALSQAKEELPLEEPEGEGAEGEETAEGDEAEGDDVAEGEAVEGSGAGEVEE